MRTPRRLILTGTPLQNNLAEYHAMLSWIRPNILGSLAEFRNRFINPIENAMAADANASDERRARQRMAVLHDLVEPFVHRRTAEILKAALPPKREIARPTAC